MRPDVHAAALRSAAKLVLGMASIASVTVACAATSEEPNASGSEAVTAKNNDGDDDTNTTGDDDDDTTNADAGATTPECASTLKAAFPGQDKYQWTPVKQPEEVVDCCNAELSHDGAGTKYRWECCVAYDKLTSGGQPDTVSRHHGMACTPWGPPVPPRMNRMRRPSPARQEMNVALVAHLRLVA